VVAGGLYQVAVERYQTMRVPPQGAVDAEQGCVGCTGRLSRRLCRSGWTRASTRPARPPTRRRPQSSCIRWTGR